MAELKEQIKDFAGDILYKSVYNTLVPMYNGPKGGHILLLPPSDLDGSFGDELMVCSFIANFSQNVPVTIFTDHLIVRDDFLKEYKNVHYLGGFQVRNYKKWKEVLETVSEIFIIGADALDGSYSSRHSLRYIRLAKMARKMGKAVRFSGFSVSKKATDIVKEGLKEVAEYVTLKARDLDSYERLKSFIDPSHLLQVSDMAFVCPYSKTTETEIAFTQFKTWADQQHEANRTILAICPNSIHAEKIGIDRFYKEFKALTESFKKEANVALLYLYHDIRPLVDGLSDKDLSQKLYELEEDKSIAFFPTEIMNGVQLKSYLKYSDATVTGRMHFGISGIAAGKPMFGICYANKFEGMLRLFEINPDNCLVDYTDMQNGQAVINKFLNDKSNQDRLISTHIDAIRQLSLLNGVDVLAK